MLIWESENLVSRPSSVIHWIWDARQTHIHIWASSLYLWQWSIFLRNNLTEPLKSRYHLDLHSAITELNSLMDTSHLNLTKTQWSLTRLNCEPGLDNWPTKDNGFDSRLNNNYTVYSICFIYIFFAKHCNCHLLSQISEQNLKVGITSSTKGNHFSQRLSNCP